MNTQYIITKKNAMNTQYTITKNEHSEHRIEKSIETF